MPSSTRKEYSVRRPWAAATAGFVIGVLGGLIGLGGAEFRLPVLISVFSLLAHRAVRFNLLVSLITLAFACATRLGVESGTATASHHDALVSMTAGGMLAAWFGAGALARMPAPRLMTAICSLLVLIAIILMAEAVAPVGAAAALPQDATVRLAAGFVAGILVGLISSVLGVAGGEFIIPILIFVFGADVKTAGTMSLLISLPIVLIGVLRHVLTGHYRSRDALIHLVLPMGGGSIAGAVVGGYASLLAPVEVLKALLSVILATSALKLWLKSRADGRPRWGQPP